MENTKKTFNEEPSITLCHIALEKGSTTFELLVNGAQIWVEMCNCCGHFSPCYHCTNSSIFERYEEDIYEFIINLTC